MGKLQLLHEEHCISQIGYHLVWCTKFRHSVLKDGVDIVVKNIIGQACGHYNWILCDIEVIPDHVHLFLQTRHTDSPVNIVKTLKSLTAVAVFYAFPKLKGQKFWGTGLWSRGSYYASVGNVSQESIALYIQSQKTKKEDGE
jgi:putative transposase